MRTFVIGEAKAIEEPVPKTLQRFLDAFALVDDRAQAAEEAGITWADVEEGLATSPAFRAAWEAAWRVRRVRVEDALRRKAQNGDTGAAKAFLTAHDPALYAPRLKVTHEGTVRVSAQTAEQQLRWIDKFLPERAAALPPEAEPIDVEYAEVGAAVPPDEIEN